MKLIQGQDYYIEKGKYVFTEAFLTKRGFCCRSGCRHCPYGFKKERQWSHRYELGDEVVRPDGVSGVIMEKCIGMVYRIAFSNGEENHWSDSLLKLKEDETTQGR